MTTHDSDSTPDRTDEPTERRIQLRRNGSERARARRASGREARTGPDHLEAVSDPPDQSGATDPPPGWEDTGKVGQYPDRGHRRVAHGLYLECREDLTPAQEFVRDLRAWREVLPADAVFTHLTGAQLLGWDVPELPDSLPVFASTGSARAPRRPGLICSRLTGPRRPFRDLPVAVDQPEEILLRCARDLGLIDLVTLMNSALRLGHLDPGRLEEVLESRRPGTVKLRHAWEASNRGCRSAEHSLLWMLHQTLGIPVHTDVELRGDQGQVVARVDFLIQGTTHVHQFVADTAGVIPLAGRPEQEAAPDPLAGVAVRRDFTRRELVDEPATGIARAETALGLSMGTARHRRWHRRVEESLYSTIGRERLTNRWHRQMGVVEMPTSGRDRGAKLPPSGTPPRPSTA